MNAPAPLRGLAAYLSLSAMLLLGTAGRTAAADAPAAAGPSFTGSMGSVTAGDQQLYRISFRPDIPLGKWGMALDVELFIDEEGNISDRGWEFGSSTEVLDTFLRKLYYVRYGRPGDDVFVKVGALDRVTLGYGLIMDGYRNTVQYPGIKKTGLQFGLKNVGPMGIGIEGVVNNFQDFQEGSALLGVRVSAPLAGKLEVGLTYVADLDQYGGLVDGDGDGFPDAVDAFPGDKSRALDNDGDGIADEADLDDDNDGAVDIDGDSGYSAALIGELRDLNATYGAEVPVDEQVHRKSPFNKDVADADFFSVVGLDAAYPLVESEPLQLKLYGQVAVLMDDDDDATDDQGVVVNRKAEGLGVAAPGVWLATGPLTGQVEFRHFRDDFDSGHFDNLYELDRARLDVATGRATPKDARLGRDESASGIFGRVGADIGQLVYASADYQYLTGPVDPKQQVHGSASLSQQLLEKVPRLQLAEAYYQKNNIGVAEDDFFESTENTFYGYRIGLEMASGVSILWDARYVFARAADSELERQKITTIETVFSF